MSLRPKLDWLHKLSKVRLVLMDIDGTLISANRTSFHNVIEQLKKLKPLGIEFSLATGRTIQGAHNVLSALRAVKTNMPPMISYNGAVVFSGRDNSPLQILTIDRAPLEQLVGYCKRYHFDALAYTCSATFDLESARASTELRAPTERVFSESVSARNEFNNMKIEQVPNLLKLADQFVAILLDAADTERAIAIGGELNSIFRGALRVTTSGSRFVEVCHPRGTKLDAMKTLARMRSLDLSEIMAIGDNYNDIEMIEASGVGVAVANAPADVRNAAMLVCSRSAAEGVVEALRVLVRSTRSVPSPIGLREYKA